MTFALALLSCVAAAVLFGLASKRLAASSQWVATLGAVLVPLGALVFMVRGHVATSTPDSFQVLGQFAPSGDSISVGRGSRADVRISWLATDTTSVVWVARDVVTGRRRVTASAGAPVVFANGSPVNAARVGRAATLTLLGTDSTVVRITTPRWPLTCLAGWDAQCAIRVITVPASGFRRIVRLTSEPVTEAVLGQARGALPDFSLFRSGGRPYISSSAPQRIRVNADTLPNSAELRGDTIAIGRGADAARLRFVDDGASGRQRIFYGATLASDKWLLGGDATRDRFRVVSGSVGPSGTLPLIELTEWTSGRAAPYEGVLARDNDQWRFTHDGIERLISTDSIALFSANETSTASRGHIVRIARDDSAVSPLAVIAALWVLGALLLAFNAGMAEGALPPLRTALLGLAYTLVFVRSMLAFRVSVAPPSLADAQTTLIALLVALPCCVVLIERWALLWSAVSDKPAGQSMRQWIASPRGRMRVAMSVASLLAVPLLVLAVSRGNTGLTVLAGTIVVLGVIGLISIQRLLMPPSEGVGALASPLAMLDQPRDRDFGLDRLIRAVGILLMLVAFYLELYLARRAPFVAVAMLHVGLVFALWRFVALRETIGPRYGIGWLARRAALVGGVTGLLTVIAAGQAEPLRPLPLALAIGVVAALIAAVITAWVEAPLIGPVRGGSFARRDVLPPLWVLALPAVGVLASQSSVVRRFGITLGFALGVTAALVLVRVLALLWHHDTRERMRMLLSAQRKRLSYGQAVIALVLSASLLGGHLLVDRGLLQLVIGVLIVTLFVGTAALGRKALALPVMLVLLSAGLWTYFVRISDSQLASGPAQMSTPRIRHAAARAPDVLQRQLVYADEGKAREMVNTLIQDWGIRSHASLGGATGDGLFSLPFSGRAIAAREAVTDNVYSVFVLAEHGFAGGVALLFVYVVLAGALLVAAWIAARTFAELPRALLLTACAAFIAVPALYMIGANVGVVALTGQNLPLLGLRSGADVALFVWIVMLAVAALPRADRKSVKDIQRDSEYSRQMSRAQAMLATVGVVILLLAVALVRPIWAATHAQVGPSFRLDGYATALEALVSAGDLRVQGGRIMANPTKPHLVRTGSLVDNVVRRGNRDADAPAGTHCLDAVSWLTARRDSVDVGTGCSVVGSSGGRASWSGALTTAPDGSAYLLGSSGRTLTTDRHAGAPLGVSCRDTASVHAMAFDLVCGATRMRFAVERDTLRLSASGTPPSVNGEAYAGASRALAWGDVINVVGAATFVVDTVPRAALSVPRWRNGERGRAVIASSTPLFARLDTLLAAGLRLPDSASGRDVELTLDARLNAEIQAGLDSVCVGARTCSAILVRPEHGEILSMASRVDTMVRVDAYSPLDANFRNHRAASVIKPLIATAVLARYPKLTTLAVEQRAETFETAAGWPISGNAMRTPRRGCPSNAQQTIESSCFLATSNNLYAVTLGFLGAAEPGANGMPAMEDAARGSAYLVENAAVDKRPRFATVNSRRHYGDSPLARGLADFFGAEIGARVGAFDTTLWAPLAEGGRLRVSSAWQRVSPATPQLDLDGKQFHDLHHLAGFMIGETENSWSNATLVRAASRIFTGKAVELRLVRRLGADVLSAPEPPDLRMGKGRDAVLDGMSDVVQGIGTARTLQGRWPAGVKLVGKTGTLDSDGLSGTSSFMFVGSNATGGAACSVAGVIHVEGFENATTVPPAGKDVFARVVLPALMKRGPWREARCANATGGAKVLTSPKTDARVATKQQNQQRRPRR